MKKILYSLLFSFLLLPETVFSQSVEEADRLIGVWEPSHGKARIKIDKIADKYFGKIVWLREPEDPNTKKPKVDKNNPDESLRQVPLKGYRILKDFIYKSSEWTDGTIYDPENGSTYSCVIKMKDINTLDIRGYIGIKTFGRTDVWKRLELKKK
jgi:uncharacterized protein (DUF2147 family)